MTRTTRGALFTTLFVLVSHTFSSGQIWEILGSNNKVMTVAVAYPGPEAAYELEPLTLTVGLPSGSFPSLTTIQIATSDYTSPAQHPYRFDPPAQAVTWNRVEHFRDIYVGIVKISPVVLHGEDLKLVKQVTFTIRFPESRILPKKVGTVEESLYKSRIINWDVAKRWVFRKKKMKKGKTPILPRGRWYRLAVESDGIYRLTASVLQTGGVDIQNVDPRSLRMYSNVNGGRPMVSSVGSDIPDNLVEVAIAISGEHDGSFDAEDAIVFFGRGPRGMDSSGPTSASFTQNPYTNFNYYWLNVPDDQSAAGKRVETEDTTFASPVLIDYGISYQHLEEDLENPFNSGILWIGAGFSRNQSGSIAFNLFRPRTDVPSSLSLSVFGGTSSDFEEHPNHRLKVYQKSVNDTLLISTAWGGLNPKTFTPDLDGSLLTSGPNFIVLKNVSTDDASKIHIDWATLKYGLELRWQDIPFDFFGPPNVSVAKFAISNVNSRVVVWDVTDFSKPVGQKITLIKSTGYFETSLPNSRMARFMVFVEEDVPEITSIVYKEEQTFSTLRTEKFPVEHIIIAPEDFAAPAEKLQRHRQNSVVATLQAVYDEFSGGVEDPLAIRYFLKWTKQYWRDPSDDSFPSFVLLFGDGDYDYRNITGSSQNLIPTFQSSLTRGVSSDDRFVYLDGSVPEMAVGRFPALSVSDANSMVDKTIAYESDPVMGLWRRRVTLIADDFARPNFGPIELTHTKNSESIAEMIPRSLEVQKIYMEDFPAINDGSQFGVTKPDATDALFAMLEKGTTILNYIGHGSAYQWAQEGLLTSARGDLSSINTGKMLPIWIAATCSWGRYDNVEGSAMSEEILRLPENGAVAVISTTGLITFSANKEFVLELFGSFFPNGNVTDQTLGAVYSSIKDGSTGSELFHLFGDPALKLVLASHMVTIDEVSPDTLVALQTGGYSGHLAATYPPQGEGYVLLYDADRTVTKNYEQDIFTEAVTYTLTGRTLFRGLVPFTGATFSGNFIVPKDISYATQDGRLAVYLYSDVNGGLWEGLGVKEGLVLAGGTSNPLDSEGPLISFALEDRPLEWGDHVPENSDLTITISDPLGVNVTGEVGHDIRLWFDEDEATGENLTDLFVYNPQDYKSGSVVHSLDRVPQGQSILTVQAWDNANNPAKKTISLYLTSATEFVLTNIFNYPNPFKDETQFAFEVNQEATVTIKIFTLSGLMIKEIDSGETFLGYSHVDWDGRDDFGDDIAYGAYLYQVTATPVDGGRKVTQIRKVAKSP